MINLSQTNREMKDIFEYELKHRLRTVPIKHEYYMRLPNKYKMYVPLENITFTKFNEKKLRKTGENSKNFCNFLKLMFDVLRQIEDRSTSDYKYYIEQIDCNFVYAPAFDYEYSRKYSKNTDPFDMGPEYECESFLYRLGVKTKSKKVAIILLLLLKLVIMSEFYEESIGALMDELSILISRTRNTTIFKLINIIYERNKIFVKGYNSIDEVKKIQRKRRRVQNERLIHSDLYPKFKFKKDRYYVKLPEPKIWTLHNIHSYFKPICNKV